MYCRKFLKILATPQFLNSKWEDSAEELGNDREYYHSIGGESVKYRELRWKIARPSGKFCSSALRDFLGQSGDVDPKSRF